MLNKAFQHAVLKSTGASSFKEKEVLQTLWSGYGSIIRLELQGAELDGVIVKLIRAESQQKHPRGWNTNLSHQRKLKSYQVESQWYKAYSKKSMARLPQCYGIAESGDEILIILEDLDRAGFGLRKSSVNWYEIQACIKWLADFHASYLNEKPDGLWEVGTYWHLETRPQELEALNDKALKKAAHTIDEKLNKAEFKTLVHGDAKLANFCFSPTGEVAGLDFQYVGGGCGMKDLAYFLGSCLKESDCERLEALILDTYFNYLQQALPSKNTTLEEEWRSLYHYAWADFHRFLKGWSPGHWKINSYSERISEEIIKTLV